MKIKVTSLVDAQISLKGSKGDIKVLAGKKSITMDEHEYKQFQAKCEIFKNSGKLKIEEVKGKAKAEPKPEPKAEEKSVEESAEKPVKKVSKKVSKKAQGRSKKRARKA